MIPFPKKKYNIIYADPPWQYKRNGNHSAESKYNVMSIEDIKKAKELNNKNIEGIIVGKAIYDGDIKLEDLAKEIDA